MLSFEKTYSSIPALQPESQPGSDCIFGLEMRHEMQERVMLTQQLLRQRQQFFEMLHEKATKYTPRQINKGRYMAVTPEQIMVTTGRYLRQQQYRADWEALWKVTALELDNLLVADDDLLARSTLQALSESKKNKVAIILKDGMDEAGILAAALGEILDIPHPNYSPNAPVYQEQITQKIHSLVTYILHNPQSIMLDADS